MIVRTNMSDIERKFSFCGAGRSGFVCGVTLSSEKLLAG